MKLPRRQFLHLAAGASALPAVSHIAWALTYPTRPVRIIVGFPAGLGPDITTRLIRPYFARCVRVTARRPDQRLCFDATAIARGFRKASRFDRAGGALWGRFLGNRSRERPVGAARLYQRVSLKRESIGKVQRVFDRADWRGVHVVF